MRMPPPGADRPEGALEDLLALEALELSEDHARGRIEVEARHTGALGVVPGGLYALLAESLCAAAEDAHAAEGMARAGGSNHTSVVSEVREGTLGVEARRRHRGRRTRVWTVDFVDSGGALCAVSRITLALRTAGRAA